MSGESIGRDVVLHRSPSEGECGAVELFVRYLFFVEVSFADHEKMTGGVVAGRGVADELRIAQLVDVSVAIDAAVVGNVDPTLRVLMVSLVLPQAGRRVRVVAEQYCGVVDGHEIRDVGSAAR